MELIRCINTLQNRVFGEGKIGSFLHTENRGLRFITRKGQGSKELEDMGAIFVLNNCFWLLLPFDLLIIKIPLNR